MLVNLVVFSKRYFLIRGFQIFGAPVYLHISAVIALVLLGLATLNNPIFGILAVASYFAIILLHESGHAFVAHKLGLEILNIQVGWIHGACEYEAAHDELGSILVAWGGVAAQLLVAVPILSMAALFPLEDHGIFGPILIFLGYVNLMIALINLAPSRLLDGGLAWRIVPYWFRNRRSHQKSLSAKKKAQKKWRIRD